MMRTICLHWKDSEFWLNLDSQCECRICPGTIGSGTLMYALPYFILVAVITIFHLLTES